MLAVTGRAIVPRDQGKLVSLGGVGVHFKIDGKETGGVFSIVEHPVQPGTLVPPHTHSNEDELSYVIEGEFGVKVGDQIFTATRGCYVFKPRGIPHTFWNAGNALARLVEIIFPSGFDRYFEEMAKLFPPDGGSPDFQEVAKLADRYGITFQMDWIPELVAKYPNLKLLGQ